LGHVKIITDSAADLSSEVATGLGLTVLPLQIQFGSKVYRDGIEITADDFFDRASRSTALPSVLAPPLKLFDDTYAELMRQTDSIVAIHSASKLSQTFRIAQRSAMPLLGRAKIVVIDSQLIGTGLGMLVTAAARAAEEGSSLDEVVRLTRGLIPHIYLAFFADTLDYLEHSGRIRKAQAILGGMLNIKPLLIMEDGDLVALEKVRTRTKAIEKLVEFIVEFAKIERMLILHSDSTEDIPLFVEQINLALPNLNIQMAKYGPVLAAHIGPGALGVVVYEGT
jgi:DegV family protein with EDD domain